MQFDNPFAINGHIDNYKFVESFGDKSSPLCVYNYGNEKTSGLLQDRFYIQTKATNYFGLQTGKPQFDIDNDMSAKQPAPWIPQQHGIYILRKPPILPMFS